MKVFMKSKFYLATTLYKSYRTFIKQANKASIRAMDLGQTFSYVQSQASIIYTHEAV